jgi:pyridoxamine 5'-phosphate oxidase
MNPLEKFTLWHNEECATQELRFPNACCLSTIGTDGYPNARFVSLKEVTKEGFIITGTLSSRKGIELQENPTAALTFWWTATERQVRIQGDILNISEELANRYFDERPRDAKLVSTVFDQGTAIESLETMKNIFQKEKEKSSTGTIHKPSNWSGFYIRPKRIEFMQLKESRLHERTVFEGEIGHWKSYYLQP